MLADGRLDAFIGPRMPSCVEQEHPGVGCLFPDPVVTAADYFKRTGIFPIMYLVGIRKTLVEQHPWLPVAAFKAMQRAKIIALERLGDTSATKMTLPFVEEQLKRTRDLMGRDFWPYGVDANRATLDAFLRYHHAQGLSSRCVSVEELFHPTTIEAFKL